ncbi:MAG: hypothetical protein K1X67_11815 [Fimbriimonadaceae bacterium]|nr:hypothetical protein [Fimbriimonadaceae bacterium]
MKLAAITVVLGLAMGIGFAQEASKNMELKVSSNGKNARFSVQLGSSKAKHFNDQASLAGYLKQVYRGPAVIRFVVSKGTSLEATWTAVKACAESGVQSVSYFGCIPPGCGILAGVGADQTRYSGRRFQVDRLNEILVLNSQKC